MLRKNHLNKKEDSLFFNWSSIIFLLFAIIGFIVLLSLQFYILGNEDTFIKIFSLIKPLATMIFIVILVRGLWNLMWSIKFNKYKKDLEKEFFKAEVKPRK